MHIYYLQIFLQNNTIFPSYFRKKLKYGVCILCDRMKEEEDSRGKGPINGNTCQCPDALTCEHCKDKDTDVTSEDDKYLIHRFVY